MESYQLKDYLYTINQSKHNLLRQDSEAVKGYPPFIINKCLSGFTDSILFANEMNIHNHLDKQMQYDFYLNSLKPRKRFSPWLRKGELENLELVKQYYGYNHSKAVAALRILTNSELEQIKKLLDKGGNR
jgi:hypothetical protein